MAVLLLLGATTAVLGQQQQQGTCTLIQMSLSQQLTMERVGFLATLTISDNDPTDPITGFAANLTFEDPSLSTNGVVNDSSSLFFVQPPTLLNIQGVAGNGSLGPGQTATISWFIIPTTTAGGASPGGKVYRIGASLSGQLRGIQIPAATLTVIPAPVTVYPDAQLQITYFQPRDVLGDNPFTPQVESPVPFTFGVLVQNVGYGLAKGVTIASQQPKITSNVQNALIIAQLLGSRVNDSPLSNANLTVNLGNLQPGQTTKGAWDMIVSLSGTFLSVSASYSHSPALGGSETSLIKGVNAYLFLHEVLDDTPGRDNVRDFLADTGGGLDAVGNLMPDSVYESDGGVFPVTDVTNAPSALVGNTLQITLASTNLGWTWIRVNDPKQAKLPLASVVRSDGKVLNTNNFWTNVHYEKPSNFEDFYLNVFDLVSGGPYTYEVTYGPALVSTSPPVTALLFEGTATLADGVYQITPATQMYFISQDVTPVSIVYSLDGGPFQPGLPFTLSTPGLHEVVYYATDASNLRETNHTAYLSLSAVGTLGFGGVSVSSQPFYATGGALSVRPGTLPISFQAQPDPVAVNAQIDIFPGVVGWPTVSGVPSSPTAATAASLAVAGQNVDYYIYSLNGQGWSTEAPVGNDLTLSGLEVGTNSVAILGRSQYGGYLSPTNALAVSWVIDPSAPPTTITGGPATPTRGNTAQFSVAGAGITNYEWTVDGSYYRAGVPVSTAINLTNLAAGPHLLAVLGEVGGVYQPTNNPTTLGWTYNSLYGYSQGPVSPVRSIGYTNVSTNLVTFAWDGESDGGVVEPPGWYTIRVTLTDALGETNFTVALAQMGAVAGSNSVLVGASRGPANPYARGRWAVWQDQSMGNSGVYAADLTTAARAIIPVSNSALSQQNPKTDGRYVVWQARQTDGDWDIYYADLSSTNGPQQVTFTSDVDEVNPAIDWPWIVYQARSNLTNTAPWQVFAYNLANGQTTAVSPSGSDEATPDVQAGRVVWQDWRDVGPGEIYLDNLETGQFQRITTNTFGQYSPVIYDNWIVWQDNRNVELDLYGFDLLRKVEVRITDTLESETSPRLNGPWVVCLEDSLGAGTGNGRLVHLPTLTTIPVTRTPTLKGSLTLADGNAVWIETTNNQSWVAVAPLPTLQPVFAQHNTVAVTDAMVADAQNAYGLLSLWGPGGVQSVTAYGPLVPQVEAQTALITGGVPGGTDFGLVSGSSLWVGFGADSVLDLGVNNAAPINLAAGPNVFGYTRFPDGYTAFQLLTQLGLANAQAVRMLDAQSGRWVVAEVLDGVLAGADFPIPTVAVVMVEMAAPVTQFTPQSQ